MTKIKKDKTGYNWTGKQDKRSFTIRYISFTGAYGALNVPRGTFVNFDLLSKGDSFV